MAFLVETTLFCPERITVRKNTTGGRTALRLDRTRGIIYSFMSSENMCSSAKNTTNSFFYTWRDIIVVGWWLTPQKTITISGAARKHCIKCSCPEGFLTRNVRRRENLLYCLSHSQTSLDHRNGRIRFLMPT